MCGRFTQTKSREEVLEILGDIELPPLFHGRYNIAPTQAVPVIRQTTPDRAESYIWGFENPGTSSVVINARSETLHERPMFKDLISCNRCLIPADGFFEWKEKQPYFFQTERKQLFGFAGLWKNGSCVIITREADSNMQGIHHRMPIILTPDRWKEWLMEFKVPHVPPTLCTRPVSRRVNRVVNDDSGCLDPGEVQTDLSLFPDEA